MNKNLLLSVDFFLCYLFLFIVLYVYLYSGGGRGEGKAHFSTQSTLTGVVRLKYENQKLFIRPQDITTPPLFRFFNAVVGPWGQLYLFPRHHARGSEEGFYP